MKTQETTLGEFTRFTSLDTNEQEIVRLAWEAADSSANNHLCFQSDFPVGAAMYAANAKGQTRFIRGCNVENNYFPATICAERNAATTAAVEGYTKFLAVAVVCRKFPGGAPCGLCRQVLNQFGRDAVLLNIVDHDSNVRRAHVGDLLPAASGTPVAFGELSDADARLVRRVVRLMSRPHVPYSKSPRAALFVASNDRGHTRIFNGVTDDNASYGATASAETVAMRTARTAGYTKDVKLVTTVEDTSAANPIDGECLQVLREFANQAPVWLVAPDRSVVETCLFELLPESFGPDALV